MNQYVIMLGILLGILLFLWLAILVYGRLVQKRMSVDGFELDTIDSIPKVIYVFWTGDNEMSINRKKCLHQLITNTRMPVKLIKSDNVFNYELKEHPYHKAFPYLSETHKADYLRTYFMHFYGGGYSDIKETTGSWIQSFKLINDTDDKWIIGYRELSGWSANRYIRNTHTHELNDNNPLVGNGCYICKSKTPITYEWYTLMTNVLDEKFDMLKLFPATFPQDKAEISNGKYPIYWEEMLGEIFHKVCFKYKNKLLHSLPICKLTNYR
jgi:hypothetical protein